MNCLIVSGNLSKDPVVQTASSGIKVAHGTVAVSRSRKDAQGNRAADFIDYSAFDKKAEILAQYGRKGDRVEMSGRLESHKYSDRNGVERVAWELIVEQLNVFPKREEGPKEAVAPKAESVSRMPDDDLPF